MTGSAKRIDQLLQEVSSLKDRVRVLTNERDSLDRKFERVKTHQFHMTKMWEKLFKELTE